MTSAPIAPRSTFIHSQASAKIPITQTHTHRIDTQEARLAISFQHLIRNGDDDWTNTPRWRRGAYFFASPFGASQLTATAGTPFDARLRVRLVQLSAHVRPLAIIAHIAQHLANRAAWPLRRRRVL